MSLNSFHRQTCLYCQHFKVSDAIECPTDANQPHLCGSCHNCPFPNAYYKPDSDGAIWINLITGDTWVDGSTEFTYCPHFKASESIFSVATPVEILNEVAL